MFIVATRLKCRGTSGFLPLKICSTAMETINEWLDQGPPQFAIAINELLRAHREQREPNWHLVSDDMIKTTMK
jgi:hypothetical protein